MTRLVQLRLKNVQSIKSAVLPVGRLTVVVGPSNVGKSALVRAVALLARNGASTGLVRKGSSDLSVTAVFEGESAIQIRRGTRLSEYRLLLDGSPAVYPKCGVSVPAAVTKFWALASTDLGELSFARQHDPPFLLKEPASGVARQIGALTNAHVLSDAVRETNRRRLEQAQLVRSFEREAAECREQLATVTALVGRRSRLEACRDALTKAEGQKSASEALRAVLGRSEQLRSEIADLEAVSGPSRELDKMVSEAGEAVRRLARVRHVTERAAALQRQIVQDESAAREWTHGALQIEADAHRMLVEAGTCPACGQSVPGARHD